MKVLMSKKLKKKNDNHNKSFVIDQKAYQKEI